jgi:hypothetical protein
MAKYSRFDPRNKKRGKHKSQSLEKDFRIKREKSKNRYVQSLSNVLEYTHNEGEINDRQLEQGYPH